MKMIRIPAPFGHVSVNEINGELSIQLSSTPPELINPLELQSTADSLLAANQIMGYLKREKSHLTYNIELDTLHGTPYQKRVWQAILAIPFGKTMSYSDVADTINSCPRAVANACGANRMPIIIPCHRVVAKSGIGGFMRNHPDGIRIKRWLLNHEGVLDV